MEQTIRVGKLMERASGAAPARSRPPVRAR